MENKIKISKKVDNQSKDIIRYIDRLAIYIEQSLTYKNVAKYFLDTFESYLETKQISFTKFVADVLDEQETIMVDYQTYEEYIIYKSNMKKLEVLYKNRTDYTYNELGKILQFLIC